MPSLVLNQINLIEFHFDWLHAYWIVIKSFKHSNGCYTMLLRQSTKKICTMLVWNFLLNLDGDKRTDTRIRWTAQPYMEMRLDQKMCRKLGHGLITITTKFWTRELKWRTPRLNLTNSKIKIWKTKCGNK